MLNSLQTSTCSLGCLRASFFGSAISMVSCYQGFHCTAGTKGLVAPTASFVYSVCIDSGHGPFPGHRIGFGLLHVIP
ncbi:MAG: ABC transporter permease [Pirellulaceae bacterium]